MPICPLPCQESGQKVSQSQTAQETWWMRLVGETVQTRGWTSGLRKAESPEWELDSGSGAETFLSQLSRWRSQFWPLEAQPHNTTFLRAFANRHSWATMGSIQLAYFHWMHSAANLANDFSVFSLGFWKSAWFLRSRLRAACQLPTLTLICKMVKGAGTASCRSSPKLFDATLLNRSAVLFLPRIFCLEAKKTWKEPRLEDTCEPC